MSKWTVDQIAQIVRESDDAYNKVLKRPLLDQAQKDPFGVAQSIWHRTEGGMTPEQYELWLLNTDEGREKNKPTPPDPEPTVPTKTRDQVKAVQSNYCNLLDSRGMRQFSPFIGGYPVPRQIDWIENEKSHGSTHLVVSVDVNGYASLHDPELRTLNFYLEDRWQEFGALLQRLYNRGLTPIIFLHSGDTYAGAAYYEGICNWWNAHFAALTEQVLFVVGWEVRRHGGHRAAQFNEATGIMRRVLGPKAIFAHHGSQEDSLFGANNADPNQREEDDPWMGVDEPDNWYTNHGVEFEVLLFQTLQPTDDNNKDEFGQPKWYNRTIDTAERFLPGGTPIPGSVGQKEGQHDGGWHYRKGYAGPDYFGRGRTYGRPVMVAFEYLAWEHMNVAPVSEARVKQVAGKIKTFGFEYFGNGLP